MRARDRDGLILQLLREQGYMSVEDLGGALGVSQMTIRRDLRALELIGLINRRHGGASLKPERGDSEWPVVLREAESRASKAAIGALAATLVHDGDVLLLDAGTTTLHVARCLDQNRLTVASNFLPILNHLAAKKNISLLGIGGNLYVDNLCFIGPLAVNTIRNINANIAILATSCLSLTKGMTNRNIAEAEVKRAMLEMAAQVVLVMDSSKMHSHTLASVGSLETIDVLVTDDHLSDEDRNEIERRGVKVLIAQTPPSDRNEGVGVL